MRTRILLADDHALVREGLKRLIDDQLDMEVVAETGDSRRAVGLAQDLAPDVALVDVSMPGLDGTQVTQMIAAGRAHVKVIALTRHDEASFVRRLLDAGAAGYVLKQSPSTELIRAIRSVVAGERYIDSSIRDAAIFAPDAQGRLATPSTHAELSAEEESVLRLIAFAHTNQEIATMLSLELSHVLTLRATATSKAGLFGRVAIMRYAEARGWLKRS